MYSKKAATYSQDDLTGTWALNSLATEDAAPWWQRGMVTVGADGSFTGSLQDSTLAPPNTVSGTINLSATGVAVPSNKPFTRCTMDAGKTVMVCSGDWAADHATSEMAVWTKVGSVPQDITGRWETSERSNGIIGALLTQTGNSITGTIRGSAITSGSFSEGIFSGVLAGISNWDAGPYNLLFALSADGQTLDGTFSVPGLGFASMTFKRLSGTPQNPDPAPPVIISSSPSPNQTNVQRQNLVVSTTWSKPVNGWDMSLTGKIGGVNTTISPFDSSLFSYNHQTNTINMPFKADLILDPMTTYTIKMDGGNDIDWYDPYGVPAWTNTNDAYSFTFTTGNNLEPSATLTLTITGSGSGSVNSITPGVSFTCGSGVCIQPYPVNTSLTLAASPSSGFLFSGWSGACSNTTGDCPLTLDTDKSATAAFSVMPPLRFHGQPTTYFETLKAALDALIDDNSVILEGRAVVLNGNFQLNRAVSLTFSGGFDAAYESTPGMTTIQGVLEVARGTLTVDRVAIQ
jgi:hypothetical protein